MDISGANGVTVSFGTTPFSSADFESADAGSGDFQTLEPSVGNVLQHHMNRAASIAPDPRDILRPWKRQVQDALNRAEERLVSFLQTPNPEGPSSFERHRAFMRGLDTPGFMTSASWLSRNIADVVDNKMVLEGIEGAIGMSLSSLQEKIRCVMDLYTLTITEMDKVHTRMMKNIDHITQLTRSVMAVPASIDTESGRALRVALLSHIDSEHIKYRIEDDYKDFCLKYSQFQAYRSVLCLLQGALSTTPTCTICMTDPITCSLVPCGHTFCNACTQKQRIQCYVCRTAIREKQRLYFT